MAATAANSLSSVAEMSSASGTPKSEGQREPQDALIVELLGEPPEDRSPPAQPSGSVEQRGKACRVPYGQSDQGSLGAGAQGKVFGSHRTASVSLTCSVPSAR